VFVLVTAERKEPSHSLHRLRTCVRVHTLRTAYVIGRSAQCVQIRTHCVAARMPTPARIVTVRHHSLHSCYETSCDDAGGGWVRARVRLRASDTRRTQTHTCTHVRRTHMHPQCVRYETHCGCMCVRRSTAQTHHRTLRLVSDAMCGDASAQLVPPPQTHSHEQCLCVCGGGCPPTDTAHRVDVMCLLVCYYDRV